MEQRRAERLEAPSRRASEGASQAERPQDPRERRTDPKPPPKRAQEGPSSEAPAPEKRPSEPDPTAQAVPVAPAPAQHPPQASPAQGLGAVPAPLAAPTPIASPGPQAGPLAGGVALPSAAPQEVAAAQNPAAPAPLAAPGANPTSPGSEGAPLTPAKTTAPAPTPGGPQAPALELEAFSLQLDPDGGGVRLDLEPAELGRVAVQLEVKSKSVRALLRVESQGALDALKLQLPELRQAFEARGLVVQDLQLTLDQRGASEERRSHEGSSGRRQRHTLRIARTENDSTSISTPSFHRATRVRAGGIDTFA